MSILNVKINRCGREGIFPRIIYLQTDDTPSTLTTPGYLNSLVDSGYRFAETDAILASTKTSPSAESSVATWYEVSISGSDYSLKSISSPGAITLPVSANTIARFDGTEGQYQDSGINVASGNILTGANKLTVNNVAIDTNTISTTNTNGDFTLSPDGTGAADLQSDTISVNEIIHLADADNKLILGNSSIDIQTGGSSRLDLNNAGLRLGGSNSRVATILDEDNMSSDSDTSLITQQSAKAYVDGLSGSSGDTYVTLASDFTTSSTSAVDVTGLAFTPDPNTNYLVTIRLLVQTDNVTYKASLGVSWPSGLDDGSAAMYIVDSPSAGSLTASSSQWLNTPHTADVLFDYAEIPDPNVSFLCYGTALVIAGSSPSGTFKIQCRAENVAQTLTVKSGSFIRYEAY